MMIALLIEHYLAQNKMSRRKFADKIGFHRKTITSWRKGRQVPTFFSAQCLLDLLAENIIDEDEKLIYEETFWWIWETEYCARINQLRQLRCQRKIDSLRLLQHLKKSFEKSRYIKIRAM
jgi:DNA-binding XRE family transcriptional regulator